MTFAATAQNQKRSKPETKTPAITPTVEAQLSGGTQQIPVNKIVLVGKHDRQGKTDEQLGIAELSESISISGLQQPIMVVPLKCGDYNLVFGERRLRAVRRLGWKSIAAIVRDDSGKSEANAAEDVAESRAVENIHRLDPTPIGEAIAISDLFNVRLASIESDYRASTSDKDIPVSLMAKMRTQAIHQTAEQVGKPVSWVRDRMYLAGFEGAARDLITSGKLPLAHAREIAKVADPRTRDDLAKRYAAGGATNWQREAWQAGRLDELKIEVAKNLYSLTTVPWNLTSAFDGKVACAECPHNSANNPGLFEGSQVFVPDARSKGKVGSGRQDSVKAKPEPAAGVCTKPSCYMEKTSFASRALSGAATKVINNFEPAKAAKEKGAAKLLAMPAIRELTPAFIDPAAVKERVQARMAPKKKASASANRNAFGESPETAARWRGENEFIHSLRDWVDKKATPAFADWLAKKPGRWSIWALILRTKVCERIQGYNAQPKFVDSPELLSLFRLLEQPSLENVLKVERACGLRFGLFERFRGDKTRGPAIDKLLKLFEIEVDPIPEKSKFVDAELAKLKKPAAKDGAKKPAAKKSSKDADTDDDQEDSE